MTFGSTVVGFNFPHFQPLTGHSWSVEAFRAENDRGRTRTVRSNG